MKILRKTVRINYQIWLLLLFIQATTFNLLGQRTIKIEVDQVIFNTVNKWQKGLSIFTPIEKNIQTLDGLTSEDISCWGMENLMLMMDFMESLKIDSIKTLSAMNADTYNESDEKPSIYITWEKYAKDLKDVAHVELVLKKSDSGFEAEKKPQASEIEQQLQSILKSSDYFVGVDPANTFVAIPVSGIKSVVKNKIYLKGGTTIAMKEPTGAYDQKEFAQSLIDELKRSGGDSFSFTTDRNGNLISTGSTKTVKDNFVITVTKIIEL
jgi:hypothetical protein